MSDDPTGSLPSNDRYLQLLRRWNARINLVAAGDVARLEDRHLADSLALLDLIPESTRFVSDLGTGAGFPGLPLAIARPDLDFTLLDAKTKAIAFLKSVRRELGLENVSFFHGRVDAYEPSPAPDLIVSRAAFPPPLLLEIAAALLPAGPTEILPGDPRATDEHSAPRHLIVMLNKDNDPPGHPGFRHLEGRPASEGRSNHLYQRLRA